jgi:ABC-type branched-subunit amino acid transport system permease subunit
MFSAAYSTVTVAAAVSLFLLKRAALYLFIVTLAFYLLSIRLFEATEVSAGLGSYSNPQEFTKLAFQLGVIYYCWHLTKRGVLA